MTLSTPIVSSNLATSAAEIGTLGAIFLSYISQNKIVVNILIKI